jgi:hypothetical protein
MSDPRHPSGAPGQASTMNQPRPAVAPPHVPHVPHPANHAHPHAPHPQHAAQPHASQQQPHAHSPHPQAPRPAVQQQPASARPGIAPMPVQAAGEVELDPIELVEEELLVEAPATPGAPASTGGLAAAPVKSKIKAFGAEYARKEHQWKRTPHRDGKGAIRVKTFHAKYSDQGMEHLDDMINEWLDSHPDVEVKFVTSTVNIFEGKIREPALVLNMWY